MTDDDAPVIRWLLSGDVSIQFPTRWMIRGSATRPSDVYGNGMILNYANYFGVTDDRLTCSPRCDQRQAPQGRQTAPSGETHFVIEPARGPGRWNTLIALRVQKAYGAGYFRGHLTNPGAL